MLLWMIDFPKASLDLNFKPSTKALQLIRQRENSGTKNLPVPD